MISVHKVIFPGLVAGCVVLVFVTGLIANPNVVLASGPVPGLVSGPAVQQGAGAAPAAAGADAPAAEQVQPADPAAAAQPETAPAGCGISASYPDSIQQWCDLIDRYAGQHQLEADLVAAVMLQESAGNAQAYSKSGAVGLMQVMPRDGLAANFMCVNGPCFASRPASAELFEPEFNVAYGTRMLAGLIQKYGDVREALRAYGPMDMGYQYADIVLGILAQHR